MAVECPAKLRQGQEADEKPRACMVEKAGTELEKLRMGGAMGLWGTGPSWD